MVGNYLINSHSFTWDQQPLDNRKYFANSVCIMRLSLSCSDWLSIVHHFTGALHFLKNNAQCETLCQNINAFWPRIRQPEILG